MNIGNGTEYNEQRQASAELTFFLFSDFDGTYGGNCTVGNLTANDFAFPFKKVNGNGEYNGTQVGSKVELIL